MWEITNITQGPVQILIKTKKNYNGQKRLTVKNIPGIGRGNNVFYLEDERHTDFVDRAERAGFIKQNKIDIKNKGE